MTAQVSLEDRADAIEQKMSDELDLLYTKSALHNMEDGQLGASGMGLAEQMKHPGKLFLIGDDPRLPKMPAKPTLLDYFKYRARHDASAAERDACPQRRDAGEDHPRQPAA